MNRQIRFLSLLFIVLFLALVANLSYLQLWEADKIAAHPRNTRALSKELAIQRGRILSADGEVLARSRKSGRIYRRYYPYGALTGPITGFYDLRYGKAAIERTYNQYLLGQKTPASFQDWLDQITGRSRPGNDVILTLDTRLQKAAVQALGDHGGAVVVLDPKTGAVLALVCNPSYDPNRVRAHWKELAGDPSHPLINRATQGLYAPGSVFKIVTTCAALENNILTPTTTFRGPKVLKVYGGRVTNYADQGFGTMPFYHALEVSCNTIFAQVGLQLGGEKLVSAAEDFGFNQLIPFILPVLPSQIPSPDSMDKLELAWTAVGQGRVLVTPFQMALVASAVANDGQIMQPYLVKEIQNYRGELVEKSSSRVWRRPISKATAEMTTKMMVGVVEHGSGRAAKIANYKVAGKTGTAEPGKKQKTHAWFACFAPAENPEVVVVVLAENSGVGGKVAAPIAKEILETALKIR